MSRLGSLLANLPPESRLRTAQAAGSAPNAAWSETDWMLWSCEYSLRCLVWQQGGGKGRRPRTLPTPEERLRHERQLATAEQARVEVDAVLESVLAFGLQGGGADEDREAPEEV